MSKLTLSRFFNTGIDPSKEGTTAGVMYEGFALKGGESSLNSFVRYMWSIGIIPMDMTGERPFLYPIQLKPVPTPGSFTKPKSKGKVALSSDLREALLRFLEQCNWVKLGDSRDKSPKALRAGVTSLTLYASFSKWRKSSSGGNCSPLSDRGFEKALGQLGMPCYTLYRVRRYPIAKVEIRK